ncbi:hypothetical protein OF83DRAFT_1119121 [Amylostereum chailletii]|nr:hypothetical protein OF83DRAFT_1119121 [Amylostereum chailletii]
MSIPSDRVPIHIIDKRALVWDVDHVATLRSSHRISGVLAGTLPHLSQQNVFVGLPLVLMPEELVLLVEKQLAVLVDDPRAHRIPTIDELKSWDKQRTDDVTEQLARLAQESGKKDDKANSEAAIQKRKERENKRRQAAEAARNAVLGAATPVGDDEGAMFAPLSLAHTETPAGPPHKSTSVIASNLPYTVTIPASSEGRPWHDSAAHSYLTLEDARTAGVWTYPNTEAERAKCEIFRDLWEKGYYMGGGSKFGGDWLVYPGDPLRYHSHFVATVQTSPQSPLRPMEVVAHGRLGTATKKAHLLCGWDPVKREATYISVEWASFG